MSSKPSIRKTYGRSKLAPSSSSILFASSPNVRSSSPPSSCRLATPGPSSPIPRNDSDTRLPPSSPLFFNADESEDEQPVIPPIEVKPPRKAPTLSQGSLKGFFTAAPKKRPLEERRTIPPNPPKRPATGKAAFTQMHLTHLPLLHTCKDCSMSYVRGGEDEALHSKHHTKVVRGIPWDGLGKGKAKATEGECGWRVVEENVNFGENKGVSRIICCDGSWGGWKVDEILSMVDTVLSSPPLPLPILDRCKIFLLVTSSPPPNPKRQRPLPGKRKDQERIVSVVVAQPIKVAMRVISTSSPSDSGSVEGVVQSGDGVTCDPEPLPTPLGIHRMFTIPAYRGRTLVHRLLDAACNHTVYGCTFDPLIGEVAFSQPTESGKKTMEKWARGAARVFVDDERQL